MDIYALDKDFEMVSFAIPYDNLQWNRRYYDFGDFEVQLPLEIYDERWAYIGTADRPELGMVQKIQEQGDNDVTVIVSGFFCEKMLDDKVCYPRYIGDASKTETAVRNIFTKYKEDLPIELMKANETLLGDRTQSDFSDTPLGKKFYSILEPRELSFRVIYDYEQSKLLFGVWQGFDRTQSQTKNSFQVFSLEFGNIASRNINIDNSDYKNYAILPCNANDAGIEQNTYYVDQSNGEYKRKIVFDFRGEKKKDDETLASFEQRIKEDGIEKLMGYLPVEELDITTVSDKEYMVNYDLGDKCDVELSDIGVTMETRIVEILEVFKADGGHTLTVGLGNKRISNARRMAQR